MLKFARGPRTTRQKSLIRHPRSLLLRRTYEDEHVKEAGAEPGKRESLHSPMDVELEHHRL